jgi:hypothetical protein
VFMCSKHEVCVKSRQHGRVLRRIAERSPLPNGTSSIRIDRAVRFFGAWYAGFPDAVNQALLIAFSV